MTPLQAALAAVRGRTAIINATLAQLLRLLRLADAELVQILAGAPSDYQAWSLPTLRYQVRQMLDALGNTTGAAVDAAAVSAWSAGAGVTGEVIAAAGIQASLPRIDDRQLSAMRSFLTEKMKDVSLAAMDGINSELGLVIIGVRTPFDAIKAVSKTLEEATYKRARMVVRTELARAFSTANQLQMEQGAAVVPALRKRWLKSGKREPRISHMVIHGQEREVDKPFELEGGAIKMMYPHDPKAPARHTVNCGCVAIPVIQGWRRTQAADRDAAELARARAAIKQ